MVCSRDLRVQGFRLFFGVIVALLAVIAMRPNVAHAWPANAIQCTNNMVLTAGQTLSFGAIVPNSSGSVTVSTAGIRTSTGPTLVGGTIAQASFTGTDTGIKTGDTCITQTVTVNVSTATLTGPGPSMTVNAMTDSVTDNGTGLWDYNTTPIYVGGTLNISAGQVAGSYSGTFTITIVYQ